MNYMHRWLLAIVGVFIMAAAMSGCSDDQGREALVYDPGKEPVKIGVCLPARDASAGYGNRLLDGVRMAHLLKPVINGTLITLVLRGSDEIAGSSSITDFIEQEGLCGIIYSPGSSGGADPGMNAGPDDGALTVMASLGCSPGKADLAVLKIGSTLQDQARVAALFAARSLGCRGAAIVLDEGSDSCVRLASLFSSELIRLRGKIVHISYVARDRAGLEVMVSSLVERSPDMIYVPYAEQTSADVIALIRKAGSRAFIVVTNVLSEQEFLDRGGKSLDGVYLVTDFHAAAVRSKRAGELERLYGKNRKELGTLETGAALSADAYFLAAALLENAASSREVEGAVDAFSRTESISGITGLGDSGRLSKSLHVSQVKTGILRGSRLIYRGSIDPGESDPQVDVGAE